VRDREKALVIFSAFVAHKQFGYSLQLPHDIAKVVSGVRCV